MDLFAMLRREGECCAVVTVVHIFVLALGKRRRCRLIVATQCESVGGVAVEVDTEPMDSTGLKGDDGCTVGSSEPGTFR